MNLFALSVELGMDTSSFEQGVDRARAKTSALAGELNPRFSGIGKTLTDAFTKSQLLATSIIGLAKKFTSLGEGIVNQGVAFNQQMEKYTTGFTNMLGSAEKAQAVLNQIKQDAARTPLNVDSLVQANQLLISAGVSAGEARSTILALGDAVSATGGGSEVLSRMAANLQQIKNVGKAASIDIKQFAMAGIDIYGVLADYTGKSTAEVQGMTITYDLLTAALQKASEEGGRYYNAMEIQSQTLSGRLETLKDNWSQLLGTLTKGLTETEGNLVTAAAGWVQRLQEGFETAGANGLMQAGGHIVDEVASGISAGIPSLAARAEDAVQNAICTAFAKRDTLREPEKFKPWILRIVVNNCYDLCRKYRPTVDLADVQDCLPANDPDPTVHLSLWEAVLTLKPEMRCVVTLFYYDGFSIREISRILGISDAAVKSRLSRSRKQLRLLLADESGGFYGSI